MRHSHGIHAVIGLVMLAVGGLWRDLVIVGAGSMLAVFLPSAVDEMLNHY